MPTWTFCFDDELFDAHTTELFYEQKYEFYPDGMIKSRVEYMYHKSQEKYDELLGEAFLSRMSGFVPAKKTYKPRDEKRFVDQSYAFTSAYVIMNFIVGVIVDFMREKHGAREKE